VNKNGSDKGYSRKGVRRLLTVKQEKFVQCIINGMSQREAYKTAYETRRMSDNAIDREASLLMKNPKLSQRLLELRDELVKPTIMTAQERLEYLSKVVKGEILDGESEAKIDSKLKAIDLMNKMSGEYVQKIEADVNNEVTITVELVDE
jgi:phage terminase small subunit